MKIICISDIHGNLNFTIPKCDILLIAGDICPCRCSVVESINLQSKWLNIDFRNWLNSQPYKEAACCPGNHDWIFQNAFEQIPVMDDNFNYLEDNSIEIQGLKIYGSPWSLPFYNWAFNKSEEDFEKYCDNIPDDIDILISHGPPYDFADVVEIKNGTKHIGSKFLRKRIFDIKSQPDSKLKLVVFGHNHKQEVIEEQGIKFVNASLLDDEYEMVNKPIVVDF
jgi:Icc-related predicted phosphoesterase